MIGRHRRSERSNGTASISVVPVVLPRVEVHPDADDRVSVSVDGDAHPDSPLRRARLGDALSSIAEEHGCAIRVEVHGSDGTVYADILDPPPVEPEPDQPDQPDHDGSVGVEVSGGGFLPGEPVHIAVTITTETADSDGRLATHLDPSVIDGGVVVVVLGAVSGITIVQERS